MQQLHWYPGHMTKARRMMVENLKTIDVVIELVDARAPFSTRNPDFDNLFNAKDRIVILNKADLADEKLSTKWENYYKQNNIETCKFSSISPNKEKIIKLIDCATAKKRALLKAKGITKTVRIMIAGIPNVGKSTFINSICKEKRAVSGNRPGVTKGKQWVKINPYLELMDTPGLLWPKLISQQGAIRLAIIGAINDEILDEESLAVELIKVLKKACFEKLKLRYKLIEKEMNDYETLEAIALSRGFKLPGNKNDTVRAANTLIDEFRAGKIARVTLETPEQVLEEIEAIKNDSRKKTNKKRTN